MDTSVCVGLEGHRGVVSLPDEAALSVITLEELALGVRMAQQRGDNATARIRQATLDSLAAEFDVFPVDRRVAAACAVIRASGRLRGTRFPPFDSLIAATAVVFDLPLYTQDPQFAGMPGVDVRIM